MAGLDEIIVAVQRAAAMPLPAHRDLAGWWASTRPLAGGFPAALQCGLGGGELAYCFAGGYQVALRVLWPGLATEAFGALLLSEGRHQRPDELVTTLVPRDDGHYQLDGEKSWVTGGHLATQLLVVARAGVAADGRVRTALVVVPAGAPGLAVSERSGMGLLAALPHGKARLAGVPVAAADLLPGDGWSDYGRPFRTIEDIHVSAAVAAHLAAQALRAGWPDALVSLLLGCLARLADCAGRDAAAASTHVLLAAAEQELQEASLRVGHLVAGMDDAFARDWRANGAVLALAAPARGQRLSRALARLRAAVPSQ